MKLVNAQRRNHQHPLTFLVPSQEAIARVGINDYVKIAFEGEMFWVQVSKKRGDKLIGVINNHIDRDLWGIGFGDPIEFEPKNILDVYYLR